MHSFTLLNHLNSFLIIFKHIHKFYIIMLILSLISIGYALTCMEALENEDRSILQVFESDKIKNKEQELAMKQYTFTGKEINDLGHWASCTKLPESSYFVWEIKSQFVPLMIGLCVPSVCTENDLLTYYTPKILNRIPAYFTKRFVKLDISRPSSLNIVVYSPKTYPLSTGGVVALLFCAILIAIIFLGTYFDYNLQEKIEIKDKISINPSTILQPSKTTSKYVQYLLCFSLIKNWNSLFIQTITDNTRIFDGIRAMSAGWVILGHVYYTRGLVAVNNMNDVYDIMKSPFSILGYSGGLVIDAFLWTGGFVFGFLMLEESLSKREKMPWSLKIIGRVLRLFPVYIFIMVFTNFIMPSLGDGPLWNKFEERLKIHCSQYWWTHFLFLNNLIPYGYGNFCIGHSWYIAVDFQLFIFSIPIFLLYLKYNKKYTWLIAGILCIASIIIRIIIANENGIMIGLLNSNFKAINTFKIYTKPYSRIGVYIPGLLCGFIFSQHKLTSVIDETSKKIIGIVTLNKKIAYSIFLLGFLIINLTILIHYLCFQDMDNDYMYLSYTGNVIFIGFENFILGIGFTCLFLPVLLGMLPLVFKILSWNGWLPIAKASFSIYLTHYCVMLGFVLAERSTFTASHANFFKEFVFGATMSISFGILVYLAIEAPFGRIFKLVLAPKSTVLKEKSS